MAIYTYTGNTTYTVPFGVTSVVIEAYGGGGAGGGQNLASDGGGGGGGGAYAKSTITVSQGDSISVIVGVGGTGVASSTGENGGVSQAVRNSIVLVSADAGRGGSPSTGTPPAGGAGGSASASVGDVKYSGGQGEIGRNNNAGLGGYGGSSAGTNSNGYSGPQTWATQTYPTASTPTGAYHGGNGGGAAGENGYNAPSYAGGGGGSAEGTTRTGGNGGKGLVIITETIIPTPIVTTNSYNSVFDTFATIESTVTFSGTSTVTARGVCYNTTGSPTTSDSTVSDGSGLGNYTTNITGLTTNTTYYIKSYATNANGTSYGSGISFTTLNNISSITIGNTNSNSTLSYLTSPLYKAQSFTFPVNGTLKYFKIGLYKEGTPNFNIGADLHYASGSGTGTTIGSYITGSTTTIATSILETVYNDYTFSFDSELSAGTYAIVFKYTNVVTHNASNCIDFKISSPNYDGGVFFSHSSVIPTGIITDYDIYGFFGYTAPSTASQIKVYDGSQWILKSLKRYNGSQWVDAILKRWDGSQWITE